MRRFALIAITALSIAGRAWAQTAYNSPGGLPARPLFQNLTVNASTGRACGAKTGMACFLNNTSGHTAWAVYVQLTNTAGNTLGQYINCSGDATDTCLRVDTSAGTTLK